MLNKNPIFINGFQYGGTNILLNLLGSHPTVCLIDGETHQIFVGRTSQPIKKWFNKLTNIPLQVMAREHIFSHKRLTEPHLPSPLAMHYIDWLFYLGKLTAARYNPRPDGSTKPVRELANARMIGKNVNGTVFTSRLLHKMYPDATFIGLVRNGLALCEGFMRRGKTAAEFGQLYQSVGRKMLHDLETIPNYKIIRFEDMIANPVTIAEEVYEFAHLDKYDNIRIRLQSKASMSEDGVRRNTFGGEKHKELRWLCLEEINGYFRQDVNDNQIARLSDEDKESFLGEAEEVMREFGYLQAVSSP